MRPYVICHMCTSIDGKPGDSGAPLVDLLGRVVGLVHGGVRCRIATPGEAEAVRRGQGLTPAPGAVPWEGGTSTPSWVSS